MPETFDIACIMYTSGTTGPAKGVLMPHAHCFLFGLGTIDNLQPTERDRFYIALPLFHANGLSIQLGATLIAGATATIRERFSASNWVADIRRAGATVTNVLGAVSAFCISRSRRSCSKRSNSIHLWSLDGEPRLGGDPRAHEGGIFGVLALADGLVSWASDGAICSWSLAGEPRPGADRDAHEGGVWGVLALADGLVSWGYDGAIRFWNLTGEPRPGGAPGWCQKQTWDRCLQCKFGAPKGGFRLTS
jgi:hypothetical protein